MENASKALIIAGAILLAILIIGLGVFIYNQASNTVGETGMDQVAIRQFNGQFEPYINKTIDSTAAKALIDTVNSSNNTGKNLVRLPEISNKSQIQTGHKYNVEAYQPEGVINEIIITDTITSASTGGSSVGDGEVAGGGGAQEEPTEPDPYLEDLVSEFNYQFNGLIPVKGDNNRPKYLYPSTAVRLVEIIENSNKEYDWQVQQYGEKVSIDTSSLCYAVIAQYDNSTGRVLSITFQGRDSIPDNII